MYVTDVTSVGPNLFQGPFTHEALGTESRRRG